MLDKIKMLAPGTKLRKSLEDIVAAKFGALLVFVNGQEYENLLQGGFRFDISFAPERLYELCKMDGAIILDEEGTRILGANVHLVPDATIPTTETGTRHRTAERISKQMGFLVLAISSRRNVITVYYENNKYMLKDIKLLLARATQTLYTLEEYRINFDKMLNQIEIAELHNRAELRNVVEIIIKGVNILKILEQIEPYVIELGNEGNLVKMQLEEMVGNFDETRLIDEIRSKLGALPRAQDPTPVPGEMTSRTQPLEKTEKRDVAANWFALGWESPEMDSPDYHTMEVLDSITGGSMNSRLFIAIREQRGLAYQVSSFVNARMAAGIYVAYIGTKPSSYEQAKEVLVEEVRRMGTERVADEELANAKSYLKGMNIMSMESNGGQAGQYVQFETLGVGYDFVDRYVKGIEAVTADDILRVAKKYLDGNYALGGVLAQ